MDKSLKYQSINYGHNTITTSLNYNSVYYTGNYKAVMNAKLIKSI